MLNTSLSFSRRLLRSTWMRALLVLGLFAGAAHAASDTHKTSVSDQPPLHLGLQMGLFGGSSAQVFAFGQSLSNTLNSALKRPVIWAIQTAQQPQAASLSFMFIRPPDMTAALLSKGWKLVAVTKGDAHFGVDLIAQPCPAQHGNILLGGPKMALLGLQSTGVPVCIDPRQAWTSPAAVLLTPKAGSLVERVAIKLWQQHNPRLPQMAHPGTQEGVVALMRDMQIPAIGAVTPLIARKWQAQGGMIVAQMQTTLPLGALVAAPTVSDTDVAAVRTAFLDAPSNAVLAKTLQVTGWETGQPQDFAKLLKFLAP